MFKLVFKLFDLLFPNDDIFDQCNEMLLVLLDWYIIIRCYLELDLFFFKGDN
jgi:hypothetical protein